MNKVAIIGKFGAKKSMYDGQTVKTKNLVILLENAGDVSITKVDTCYFRKNNLKLLIDSIMAMIKCDHVFLMVSTNGMRFYLPFLFYLNKIFHRKIYHYVIGSELLDMVKNDKSLVKYLNAMDVNWFEYESGTRYLREMGVENVSTLTNFKMINPIENASAYCDSDGIYRYCTFSRVMEEKGITDAIETISAINRDAGRKIAHLDVYGPIEEQYTAKLNVLLRDNSSCVTYKGIVDSQGSVDVLKDYYALLFPTRWIGEGVPGTVIDAYAAGVPVIATDWNANGEIIRHNESGILYPNASMKTLYDAVCWSIQNIDGMNQMRIMSREMYSEYSPETIMKVIQAEMMK